MSNRRGLADFVGHWRIERQIEDHASGQPLSFSGRATLTDEGGCLLYEEAGTLVMPGQAGFHATRRYTWREVPGAIQVYFDDGRYFHSFDPNAAAPEDRHWCDPDTYEARYSFEYWPLWQADWRVRGPRKDYVSRTSYSRD